MNTYLHTQKNGKHVYITHNGEQDEALTAFKKDYKTVITLNLVVGVSILLCSAVAAYLLWDHSGYYVEHSLWNTLLEVLAVLLLITGLVTGLWLLTRVFLLSRGEYLVDLINTAWSTSKDGKVTKLVSKKGKYTANVTAEELPDLLADKQETYDFTAEPTVPTEAFADGEALIDGQFEVVSSTRIVSGNVANNSEGGPRRVGKRESTTVVEFTEDKPKPIGKRARRD